MTAIAYHEPETTGALTLGGPAFFSEGGRRERVLILSEAVTRRDEDKVLRSWRAVAFVDEGGAEYEVQASKLEPADDATWLIAGRKYRHIMGAPPLGPYPSVRAAVVEEPKAGDPLSRVEFRGLTPGQQEKLARVDALLQEAADLAKAAARHMTSGKHGRARPKNGEGHRIQARQLLLELQREIAERQAADEQERYVAELQVLEQARGARVDVKREGGVLRGLKVRARGGLALAYERGDLEGGRVRGDMLWELAKRYRDAYERADGLSTPSGGGGKPSPEGRQLGVMAALEELATMRGDPWPERDPVSGVVTYRPRGTALTLKQRRVLDMVCGQDLAVKAAAVKLRAGVPSVKRALRGGLIVTAENKLWV